MACTVLSAAATRYNPLCCSFSAWGKSFDELNRPLLHQKYALQSFASMLATSILLLIAAPASAFVTIQPPSTFQSTQGAVAACFRRDSGCHSRQRYETDTCVLFASTDEEINSSSSAPPPSEPLFDTNTEDKDWSDFNPFQPVQGSSRSAGAAVTAPGQPLSLRAMRMKSITGDLFRENAFPSKMDEILNNNEDFLIEQLVDMECVLDVDSIYSGAMDAEERIAKYEEVMDERVAQARSGEVKRMRGWHRPEVGK
mmetsp:Transcript_18936/g.38031  ORF Transcript_18936/g.38031 Transcript_18936/m.38031 type:complete len:255 (+) Transcript_18936:2382-3146(+)